MASDALLESITDPMVRELAQGGQRRSIARGTVFIHEGERSDSLFVILSGRVKVFVADNDGREMVLDTYGPGRYVGEMSDYNIPDFKLDATSYFDLTAEYHFGENDGVLDGLSLRGGIINVANEDPVIFPSYQQSNTDPTVYDVLGRRYFVNLNYKF